MSDNSAIEWTDATWNPVTGCTKVSPGCDHCYAETFAERFRGTPGHHFENGFDVQLRPERLDIPTRWRKPRRIFVNSMSDLFHDSVPDEYIAQVFAVMALAEHHTFQVLTKRHARMRSLLRSEDFRKLVLRAGIAVARNTGGINTVWAGRALDPDGGPLRNVWLGVSVEDQHWADIRIQALQDTPAAVRWISAEPLLGPVDLRLIEQVACCNCAGGIAESSYLHEPHCGTEPGPTWGRLHWVVAGGESGPGARPMHPDWARSLRDQCVSAGVPFLFKQWGNWVAPDQMTADTFMDWDAENGTSAYDRGKPWRIGKKAAGRELDGRTWDQYPAVTP